MSNSDQKLQRAWLYSDGPGREVLIKKQAEPDADGRPRFVGSGRVLYDNKAHPVRKYEPYFSSTSDYESAVAGVSDVLTYDPLGRVIRNDHPNGSYARAQFDAWQQTTFDENDPVGESENRWAEEMQTGTPEQKDALAKTLLHLSALEAGRDGRYAAQVEHNQSAAQAKVGKQSRVVGAEADAD